MSIELIICPLCRAEIHRHVAAPVTTKIRIPSRSSAAYQGDVMTRLAAMVEDERMAEMRAAEESCADHYHDRHRLRVSLWRRFGWTWLMTWPTRKPKDAPPGYEAVDPLLFILERDAPR